MGPQRGTVVGTGTELTIRLSTRAIIRIPSHPTLRLGDKCVVLFNFEQMCVAKVMSIAEWDALDEQEEEPDWDDISWVPELAPNSCAVVSLD